MDLLSVRKVVDDVNNDLSHLHVGQALKKISKAAANTGSEEVVNEANSLIRIYNGMTSCFVSEMADPQRESIMRQLVLNTNTLVDLWFDRMAASLTTWRRYEQPLPSAEELETLTRKYLVAQANTKSHSIFRDQIFNMIWRAFPSKDFCESVERFISNADLSDADAAHAVGAVALSLNMHFSTYYCAMLLRLLSSQPSPLVEGRLAVALLLSIMKHSSYWLCDSALVSQFNAYVESSRNKDFLFHVLTIIVRTKAVKNMAKSLNNITPKLIETMYGSSDITKGQITVDHDWDELFRNDPSFKRGVDKISRWQAEGADVFWTTTRHMRDLTFFEELSRWLLPFDANNYELRKALDKEAPYLRDSLPKALAEAPIMCDSDKYSLLYSFCSLPMDNKEMTCTLYNADFEATESALRESGDGLMKDSRLVAANAFVQDLYRLYELYPHRAELEQNPFRMLGLLDCNQQLIAQLVINTIDDQRMAEFCVNYELYDDALRYYQQLVSDNPNDVDVIRKLAFCMLKNLSYRDALQQLLKVDLIAEPHFWTKHKIAECYHNLAEPTKEVEYLKSAVELRPDNKPIERKLALALYDTKQYADALKILYKHHYDEPNDDDIIREIVKNLFADLQPQQAESYLQKLGKIDNRDRIMAAHLALAQHKIQTAIDAYLSLSKADSLVAIDEIETSRECFLGKLSNQEIDLVIDIISNRGHAIDLV
ncbi:MAG: hypothetical protein J6Y72_08620 [Bacteroidales bacterium]|nr:hypothetical protein [Bacteroidales bacterium]